VRKAIAIGALVVDTSAVTLTTLPRPPFPGPAGAGSGPKVLTLVASKKVGVAKVFTTTVAGPRPHGLPLLPNGPERTTLRGNVVHVRTYDHVVLARLRGA